MITMQIVIVIGCCVWLLLGLFFWALIHGGKDTQADIEEPGDSYVDQDGETFYPGRPALVGSDSCNHAWGFFDVDNSYRCRCGAKTFENPNPQRIYMRYSYDPDAWKHNNGIKVPHADSSAATFHRAGDA
jgi:hypothetical protein